MIDKNIFSKNPYATFN